MLLESYAERVRFIRSMTKLSREAFESKYGINRNTLKSWELGINTLTEKSATQLANAFRKEGFSCSPEWLIFGIGAQPTLSINSDESVFNEISEQSKIIYEAEYFKKNNLNAIVIMITDLSMFPRYKINDFVGGINQDANENLEKLNGTIGKICITSLINETLIVRKIIKCKKDFILLCPLNNKFSCEIVRCNEIKYIANIIWHRTTFK